MSIPTIITGDLNTLDVELTVDGTAIAIDPAAAVKVAIVSNDSLTVYAEAVSQVFNSTGADWPNGVVAIILPKTSTASIAYQGAAKLEIQVDPGDAPSTWFVPIKITKGNIA